MRAYKEGVSRGSTVHEWLFCSESRDERIVERSGGDGTSSLSTAKFVWQAVVMLEMVVAVWLVPMVGVPRLWQ